MPSTLTPTKLLKVSSSDSERAARNESPKVLPIVHVPPPSMKVYVAGATVVVVSSATVVGTVVSATVVVASVVVVVVASVVVVVVASVVVSAGASSSHTAYNVVSAVSVI